MEKNLKPQTTSVNICGDLKKRGKLFGIWSTCYCELHRTDLFIKKDKNSENIKEQITITPDTKIIVNKTAKIPYIELILPSGKELNFSSDNINTLMRWAVALHSSSCEGSMISMESFDILSVIGRGYFGKVLLVQKKETEELYAIKTVKKERLINTKQIHTILEERNILAKVKHPFVVGLNFAFQTASKFYIGMEYVPGGDFVGLLNRFKRLDIEQVRIYAGEIALAVDYLHSIGVVFRDLKPDNILIAEDGHLKLTDFGLSKDISQSKTANTFCGTPEFIAPEIINHHPYSYEVDWWSFGILVYEMLFGETPFYSTNRQSLMNKIKYMDPHFPDGTDPTVIDFITQFLQKNPTQRATYKKLEGHKFWGGVTKGDIITKKFSPKFKPDMKLSSSTEYFNVEFTKETPLDSFATPMLGDEHVFEGFSFAADAELEKEASKDSSDIDENSF